MSTSGAAPSARGLRERRGIFVFLLITLAAALASAGLGALFLLESGGGAALLGLDAHPGVGRFEGEWGALVGALLLVAAAAEGVLLVGLWRFDPWAYPAIVCQTAAFLVVALASLPSRSLASGFFQILALAGMVMNVLSPAVRARFARR